MKRKNNNIKHPKLAFDSVCFQRIPLLCLKMRHQAAVSVIFMDHLSSLRSILLLSIPAARMSTMSSAVRPRRSSSCLTDRGRGPAASAVSSRPDRIICRSESHPSLLRMLDEMMWTWVSLWPSNQREESVLCTGGHVKRESEEFIYPSCAVTVLLSPLWPWLLLSPWPAHKQLQKLL